MPILWLVQSIRGSGSRERARLFVTWPPVRSLRDYQELTHRLQWCFPRGRWTGDVIVPSTGDFAGDEERESPRSAAIPTPLETKVRIQVVRPLRRSSELWRKRPAILLWKALSVEALSALVRRPTYIVDPAFYMDTEVVEWRSLYRDYRDPSETEELKQASQANFRRLLERAASCRAANVCGTGPSLQAIYDADVGADFNMICNNAPKTRTLLEHVRPSVIAIASPLLCGLSHYGRDYFAAVQYCVERFGTIVVMPSGYEHYVLYTNYAWLRSHLIGVDPVEAIQFPDADRIQARTSTNVVTSLMLPIAAVATRTIYIWGCDGLAPERRGWEHMKGIDLEASSAVGAHPAFFRDHRFDDRTYRSTYEEHCRYLEVLLAEIEKRGVTVASTAESFIPAVHRRFQRPSARPGSVTLQSGPPA
jgi:hypothetical protein